MLRNEYLLPKQSDVLEVIANLSNDQVFTPPKIANSILDLLPKSVWSDPTLRWLDPASKTGIFPREITKRLMVGLEDAFPDEGSRLEHILKNMVFAIATEELTSMMTRRTLYCSKDVMSEFSAVRFVKPNGNVWYGRVEHNFIKEKCSECGGTRDRLEKTGRDNKAYGFIHSDGKDHIEKEMDMKFDVIVGNPPYQMESGDTSDVPIYNLFVEQAINLNPKYLSMIIPSRWMAGGKGLDSFRETMLKDKRIRKLVDFLKMDTVFPGVDFEGGVCYFLWDRDNPGGCETTYTLGEKIIGPVERSLAENDVFVRDFRALAILNKVLVKGSPSLKEIVSGQTPFGLHTNYKGYRKGDRKPGDLTLYLTEKGKRTEHWVSQDEVRESPLIKSWKVLLPTSYGERGALPARILGPTMLAGPNSVCTQSFLAIGPLKSKSEAESLDSYLKTRFCRFIISLRKISQHSMRGTYAWVPLLTWDHVWTDAELYKKYGITKDEQAYIETMIKEMLP